MSETIPTPGANPRQAADVARTSPAVPLLLAAGVIGPLLFAVVVLIEGATRPGYSALHYPVSSLSLDGQGWIQLANFAVCGALVLTFAFGLRRRRPRRSKRSTWPAW